LDPSDNPVTVIGAISVSVLDGKVTNHPGKYTNDPAIANIDEDFTYTINGSGINLSCLDFGGSITITATATVNISGTDVLIQDDYTVPKDSDKDGLADFWEADYGDLLANNDDDGDGLSNREEFRGFMWGPPMVEKTGADIGGDKLYQSTAWVPEGQAQHFRTDPQQWKDLFVKFQFYDFDTYTDQCGGDCRFAIGAAYANAGVRVHAVSMDAPPAFMAGGTVDDWAQNNIDVVYVINVLSGNYGAADGHIDKRGVRDWTWDVKGFSAIGNNIDYGAFTLTYKEATDNYFNDKPYIEAGGSATALDANIHNSSGGSVQDINDNGINNVDAALLDWEAGSESAPLDGDRLMLPIGYTHTYSALDINNNGMVELPLVADPNDIPEENESTKAQVLKHTITHEMGHAVGMTHNSNSDCLMYEYSQNWRRDHNFSDFAKGQMRIHNH